MNTVRFRELLKRMHEAGVYAAGALHQLLHAPIFAYERRGNLGLDELEWCQQNVCGGESRQIPTRLPFPMFSIMLRVEEHDDGVEPIGIIVSAEPRQFTAPDGTPRTSMLNLVNIFKVDDIECWLQVAYTGPVKDGCALEMWKNGQRFKPTSEMPEAMNDVASIARVVVLMLCFDLFSTNSTAIRVEPPANGRTVQWVLSRTHYLILGKKQAQNLRDRQRGAGDHDIQRAAHYRRAHLRRLVSDKFKNKKGMLVPVKHSWVGPEEWVGLDRKIYKVVDCMSAATTANS